MLFGIVPDRFRGLDLGFMVFGGDDLKHLATCERKQGKTEEREVFGHLGLSFNKNKENLVWRVQ